MRAIPRSRTLHLLRSPPPLRCMAGLLGVTVALAAQVSLLPLAIERARLSEILVHAGVARIDPVLLWAETGAWPTAAGDSWPSVHADEESGITARLVAGGLELVDEVPEGAVQLELAPLHSIGGPVAWRCRIAAVGKARDFDPLTVPAACRE